MVFYEILCCAVPFEEYFIQARKEEAKKLRKKPLMKSKPLEANNHNVNIGNNSAHNNKTINHTYNNTGTYASLNMTRSSSFSALFNSNSPPDSRKNSLTAVYEANGKNNNGDINQAIHHPNPAALFGSPPNTNSTMFNHESDAQLLYNNDKDEVETRGKRCKL